MPRYQRNSLTSVQNTNPAQRFVGPLLDSKTTYKTLYNDRRSLRHQPNIMYARIIPNSRNTLLAPFRRSLNKSERFVLIHAFTYLYPIRDTLSILGRFAREVLWYCIRGLRPVSPSMITTACAPRCIDEPARYIGNEIYVSNEESSTEREMRSTLHSAHSKP
jgi:hypothetical protein